MELTFSLNFLRPRSRQFLISFLRTSPNSSTAFVNGSEIPNDQNARMATMNYAARRGRLIRRQGPQIVTQSKFQNGGGNVPDVCRKSDPSWSSLFLPQTIAPHATSNTGAVFRVEKSTGMLFSRRRLLLLLHGRGTYNSHHSEFQFQKFKYRRWFKLRLDWSQNSIKLHMTVPHTTTWKPPVLWKCHLPGSSLNQVVA